MSHFDSVTTVVNESHIQEGDISGWEVEALSDSTGPDDRSSVFSILIVDDEDMVAVHVSNDDQGMSSAGLTRAAARQFFTQVLAQLDDSGPLQ